MFPLCWLSCLVSCQACFLWSPACLYSRMSLFTSVWFDIFRIWPRWLSFSHNRSLRNKLLPGFVEISQPPASVLVDSNKRPALGRHSNTSAGLCWCTSFSQSQRSLYPFIHLQSQLLLQLSPAHFFFSGFPPAVLWFHCRLRLTSPSLNNDLGKMLHCKPNQCVLKTFPKKPCYYYYMCSRPSRHIQDYINGIFQVITGILYIIKNDVCLFFCHRKTGETYMAQNNPKCFYVKRLGDVKFKQVLSD